MNLRKMAYKTSLLVTASILIASNVHAAFQDPYWSARVAALGGAFTALSDDASAVFYNSAAASKLREKQASFTYAKLFAGLEEVNFSLNQFAYHQPVGEFSALGVGWGSFTTDIYREITVAVSYGTDLKPYFTDYKGELALGITARYLTRSFDLDARSNADPVFSNGTRTNSAAFDFHIYSVPDPIHFPGLSAGISVKSVNQPDIGFRDTERLPTEVSGGIAWKTDWVTIPVDVSVRNGELTPHFGAETSLWQERIHLRAGSDKSQLGTGLSYEHKLSSSFSLSFDYTFLWPLQLQETSGSHRATLGIKF